jgi:hypothetical protein
MPLVNNINNLSITVSKNNSGSISIVVAYELESDLDKKDSIKTIKFEVNEKFALKLI